MSYGLISNEVDTFGPTTMGMKRLREEVLVNTGYPTPTLLNFIQNGTTDNPQQLAEECKQLASKVQDEDVQATLLNIALAASKSKEGLSLC